MNLQTQNPFSPPADRFAQNIAKWREKSPRPIDCPVPWLPVDAFVTNIQGSRSAQAYLAVLEGLDVLQNPRYTPRDGRTFCNIFVWDATRALDAELPHWVYTDGSIAIAEDPTATRLHCNAWHDWLRVHGSRHGWKSVTASDAIAAANRGEPTIALWKNPNGHGHIGMVRPSTDLNSEPRVMHVGKRLALDEPVHQAFPDTKSELEYWTHS